MLGMETKGAMAAPSPDLLQLFGVIAAASGTAVTPETAMRCTPFAACVKIVSESVMQLPLHLYERIGDAGKKRATDHPLEAILTGMANPWTSAAEFKRDMQAALLAHGKAGAVIVRVGGEAKELHQVPSSSFIVEVDSVSLEPRYVVTMADGKQRRYSYADFFYLGGLSIDPGRPVVPWHQAREAIGLAMVMEQHGAKLFANGAKPSGVLTHPRTLGPEARKRLRESFDAVHSGGANSGRTLVLDEGITWQSLTFNSVDVQFLELRKFQIAEIARVFRVPLHMLGDLSDATFSNVENMGAEFVTLTLMPWLKLWEGAIARSLLKPEERSKFYAEFLTDDLARADMAARCTAYSQAIANGILNPNEVRAMENRAPYEGGDEYRRPMNTETPGGDNRPGHQPPPAQLPKPRIAA